MEQSIIINGGKRPLTKDELNMLGYKECDFCGNIFYAPDSNPRKILVKKRHFSYIPRAKNYYLSQCEFYICEDCLEKVTNVVVDSDGKNPRFIH